MKLVIVESPTKAKTIAKFLGDDFLIESSFGHVRDLPQSNLGVEIEHDFEPKYVVPVKAKKNLKKLQQLAKKSEKNNTGDRRRPGRRSYRLALDQGSKN